MSGRSETEEARTILYHTAALACAAARGDQKSNVEITLPYLSSFNCPCTYTLNGQETVTETVSMAMVMYSSSPYRLTS